MKKIIWLLLSAILTLLAAAFPADSRFEQATFAGGCFWSMQAAFEGKPGILSAVSGYSGGDVKNPTYEDVSSGTTGHLESVQVTYDPQKTSYSKVLDIFWHNVDPTDKTGQFCDHGPEYRSAIFYDNDEQKRLAEASLQRLMQMKPFRAAIVTRIESLKNFYRAEEYHQDFVKKNPAQYEMYALACGRAERLQKLWSGK